MRSAAGAALHRRSTNLPLVAVMVAVVAWGIGPVFVRSISASGLTIAFWRLWFAVPVTVLVARLAGQPLTWRVVRATALGGSLFALSIVLGFASFQLTSIAIATLIPALQPALVLLVAGRLFGERVGGREVALTAVAFAGIAVVILGAGGAGGASLDGDLLALANLLVFTVYFLEVKRRRTAGIGAWEYLAGSMLVGAVTVTPFALVLAGDLGAMGGADWFWLACMILVPGIVGHGLMNWAQGYVDVTVSSLMTLANPVISAVAAWVVFDQGLRAAQIAGAAVVLGALASIMAQRRTPAPVVPEPPT